MTNSRDSTQWTVGSEFFNCRLPPADCRLPTISARRRHARNIVQCPRSERRACGNEHVLASIKHVCDRRGSVKRGAHLKMPEQLASMRIDREEISFRVAGECET